MKQQKTQKTEKGKVKKELQKNVAHDVVPEIAKDLLKVPPSSKE